MAPEGAARLAALLDVEAPNAGDELPMLWHWAYFRELGPQSSLGLDGHVQRRDPLAERLPRRMAASGSVTRLAPLCIGIPARRDSELLGVTEKKGRSGPLAFVSWRHVIEQDGTVTLEELQTTVYRGPTEAGPTSGDEPPGTAGYDEASLLREVRFDPTTLFRYSAVTWNSHRIHYDAGYATNVEGYPGLVVHGPLLATLLAGEATRELGAVGSVQYRARAPVFVDDIVQIFVGAAGDGAGEGGGVALEARKLNGTVAMTLVASPAR
jgi:3-methylfumaryl-CoA hydratase